MNRFFHRGLSVENRWKLRERWKRHAQGMMGGRPEGMWQRDAMRVYEGHPTNVHGGPSKYRITLVPLKNPLIVFLENQNRLSVLSSFTHSIVTLFSFFNERLS